MRKKSFWKRFGASLLIAAVPVAVYMALQLVAGQIAGVAATVEIMLRGEKSDFRDYFSILSDPVMSNALILSVGIAAAAAVLIFARAAKKGNYSLKSLFTGGIRPIETVIAVIAGVALNCAVLFAVSLFGLDKLTGGDADLERMFEGASPAALFLAVGLLGPVVEEILFRGYTFRAVSRQFNSAAAVLLSAAGFALIHGNLYQMIYAFPVGILLGLAYLFTGRLAVPVVIHVAYNSFNVLLALLITDEAAAAPAPASEPGILLLDAAILCFFTVLLTLLFMVLAYIGKKGKKGHEQLTDDRA